MSDINKCEIIKQFSDDFAKQIKFVYILCDGKSFICVTNDDCVYSYGDNTDGMLGLGHSNPIEMDKPTKLDGLCHKQVIAIRNTDQSMLALCKTGHIYSWGRNNYRQLGIESDVDYFKPAINNSLIDKVVVDVKCGKYHCLALTENGEVFEWGWSVTDVHNSTPIKVIGLELETIAAISCGEYHSLALTDNGVVYSWGDNSNGQCGTGSFDNQLIPIKLENLFDIKMQSIECGLKNSVLLSENGDIYVFGKNYCAQREDNNDCPHKLDVSTKFVDMASQFSYTIGLSNDGYCYVWGKVDDEIIDKPKKTQFTALLEAFAAYSKCLYHTIYIKKNYENLSVTERFKQSFNKQQFSDIAFKINGKFIYVQKQYLMSVCAHFIAMFSDNVWLESNAKEIEITQYSYSVYYSFLKYLYTDSLIIQSKHLIELYYLSDSYFEENLKQRCIDSMKMATNINNVYTFYSFAVKHNFDELEKYFYSYMITNMSDVIKTEAYIQTNDYSILKKFVNTSLIDGYLLQSKNQS